MTLARVAALLALAALASPAAASSALAPEEVAALEADDSCGDEVCGVELRQLRAEAKHASAERHLASEVEEAKAGVSSAFCCFAGSKAEDVCGSCYDNAMGMDGETFHGSTICTADSEGCTNCGGTWCSGATSGAGLAQAAAHKVEEAKHAEVKEAQKVEAVQKTEASPATGKCTAADEKIMAKLGSGHGSGSFSKVVADCGHGAYSFWRGFRKGSLQSCLASDTGLSSDCSSCFADAGQYGYDHCKMQCLFGSWCSESCLSCTESDNKRVAACAGVELPKATTC